MPEVKPLDALTDVLLQVEALSDGDARDRAVDRCGALLRRRSATRRFPDAHRDLSSLIRSYDLLSGATVIFTEVVAEQHPEPAALRAAEIARELRGSLLLSPPDRLDLCRILGEVGTTFVIKAALDTLADVPELQNFSIWQDWDAVVQVMERQPVAPGEVPPLLQFVIRLAELVGASSGRVLRQWAASVAGGLGVSEARFDALRLPERDDSDGAGQRRRISGTRAIRGGVPLQNHNFTGRSDLLDRLAATLATGVKAAVLPQAVHGMGGVGKTQLVLEYVYRHLEDYDLVWWIPADSASGVLASLEQLAGQLGVRPGENAQQTARLVLDALAAGAMKWLLVYDNANDPDSIDEYLPSTGGDVVVTTRNKEWAAFGADIEVDVFERHESIDLLRRRTGNSISTVDADRLAERLGDLPLALEQAASWHLLTRMPVSQYIELLKQHQKELLSEGKPAGYPESVVAFVTLAIDRLRKETPATAQLLELFAFLGGEPVPVSLLRYGHSADVVEPLRTLLGNSIKINIAIRDLTQYGLVKVDNAQRLQVHRLVQGVLRDVMDDAGAAGILQSVQHLLARANPGDPDEKGTRADLDLQREIGPHLRPADMIGAESIAARTTVLDHVRYLYNMGDYENSALLATDAIAHWETETHDPNLGPHGELTLNGRAHIANARRALGKSEQADEIITETYELMREHLGENARPTLVVGNQIGQVLRIRGDYQESLEFSKNSLQRHRAVFKRPAPYILRAQSNLAVAYRMVGDFAAAAELDQASLDYWEGSRQEGTSAFSALEAYMNIARDYYGLGAYQAGVAVVEGWRESLISERSAGHRIVLLSGRTYGILLRKAGRLQAAAAVLSENLKQTDKRFGPSHEYTIAVLTSYGNLLRQRGDLPGALQTLEEAVRRYREYFPSDHPLTLSALVNQAIALRAAGKHAAAAKIDADAYARLTAALDENHPYTLCAGTSLATDHALRGDAAEARRLSEEILERSREVSGGPHEARSGAEHPYLLARAINLSHDLRATGATAEADELFARAIDGLSGALVPPHPEFAVHPELAAAQAGDRLECDIESPPT
ncbi:FxSxx-COOH system tetratricopeptide repeat protein [Actinoplanes sp. NPDC023714]|uniref:FxSxx-COOH system tetratricopeptide repeat protein n=1 Tax=Actinoplanes sp. NPDC023714 TaxID=3154322 RepID=UPI003402B8CC